MRIAKANGSGLPHWSTYILSAMGAILFVATLRGAVENIDDRIVYLATTIPILVAAAIGGVGPGLAATFGGLFITAFMLGTPDGPPEAVTSTDRVVWAGFGVLWTFVSAASGVVRRLQDQVERADRAAQGHRDTLDAIVAGITDPFFGVDLNWRITHANPAFATLVSRPLKALPGLFLWDLYAEPGYYEVRVKLTECLRRQQGYHQDVRDPKSGRWHHLRAYPYANGMFVLMQDVSEDRGLEESRERMLTAERRARSDAEAMNRLKDEFIATLSHELRTPLTTMQGWTEILKKDERLDGKAREGLEVIERSVKRQTSLISDLQDMSRIAAGRLKLEPSIVNLVDVMYEAVEFTEPIAEAKKVSLNVHAPEEPVLVKGDPQRLYQIVSNLLSNAVKFTPAGGRVDIRIGQDEKMALCAVEDTGEGIDPDFLPFLFDPFRQSGASSRRQGGLGLGLAIVRQLVEMHGGEVSAASEGVGKGSRFEVRLPAAEVPESLRVQDDLDPVDVPTLNGLRVLVVDDDPDTRGLVVQILEDAGASVTSVECGASALEVLSVRSFDVLLSDIGMPEMDGYQLVKLARRRLAGNGGMPQAIALTSFDSEADRTKSKKAGFALHLSKPVDRDRLVRSILAAARPDGED